MYKQSWLSGVGFGRVFQNTEFNTAVANIVFQRNFQEFKQE